MTNPGDYHPRAMVMVRLVGPAMRRASLVGLAVGIGAAVATSLLLPAMRHGLLSVAAITVATLVVGMAAAMISVPPRIRRAYAAFSWLGHREAARFLELTGTRVPVSADAVRDWLERNPRGPITATARVELLVALGRFEQARAEFAALPPPATGQERLARAGLRTWGEAVETGTVDLDAFEAAVAGLPPDPAVRLEAAVVRALAETRMRAFRDQPDPLGPLEAVRPRLGREAAVIVLRDTWLRYARQLLLIGLLAGALMGFGWWEGTPG